MPTPQFRLEVGDRAPNFALPDATGKLRMIYEETRGLPILLAFLQPGVEIHEAILAGLIARQDELVPLTHPFVVMLATTASVVQVAQRYDPRFPILADEAGRITAAYRAAANVPSGPVLLLLDANQRLRLAVTPAPHRDPVAEILARLAGEGVPAPRMHDRIAPVLMVPEVIPPHLCQRLVEIWHKDGHEEGAVITTAHGTARDAINYGSKKRLDHKVKDPALARELTALIGPRFATEVFRAFHFADFRLESFFIVRYEAARGDFFRPHRDNLIAELADRRFGATVNLNDDYEGGGIRFPEYGSDIYRPPAGGAILFSSSLLHEAIPVSRGERFALLTFLRSREASGPVPR